MPPLNADTALAPLRPALSGAPPLRSDTRGSARESGGGGEERPSLFAVPDPLSLPEPVLPSNEALASRVAGALEALSGGRPPGRGGILNLLV